MALLWSNLLYAVRALRNSRSFTTATLVTLAFTIGGNATIFGLISAVLVQPLPIRDPNQVVVLHDQFPTMNVPRTTVSPLQFRAFSQRTDLFQSTAAEKRVNLTLTGNGQAVRLQGMEVTPTLFPLLGVPPEFGRPFTAEDDAYGSEPVAILSYGLWQRLFGNDRNAVGREVHLNARPYRIVGILPQKLESLYPNVEIWIPAIFSPEALSPKQRWYVGYSMLARLAPRVTQPAAQAGMESSAAEFNDGAFDQFQVEVRPLQDEELGDSPRQLYILLGSVGLLLLIACANVANLLVVRNEGRTRELTIRRVLGCGRGQIFGQLITESVLLSLIGGILGLLVAGGLLKALIAFAPADIPRISEVHVDVRVLLWTFATCLIAGALFGGLPAYLSSRSEPADVLRHTSGFAPTRRTFAYTLVASQIALALVLLVGSGLLLRSFKRLLDVNPGFVPANVLTMHFSMPTDAVNTNPISPSFDPARVASFSSSLLERISSLPGVSNVAIATGAPFASDGYHGTFEIQAQHDDPNGPEPSASFMYVTPQYFDVMKIPLISGRIFTPAEMRAGNALGEGAKRIIDITLAKRFWPNKSPIGAMIGDSAQGWATVIGVVGSVHDTDLSEESSGTIYVPGYAGTTLVVKTKSDSATSVASIRDAISQVDKNTPVYDVKRMQSFVDESLHRRKLAATLLTFFSLLALSLACVGLYAVLSHLVERRTHEIGIRVAVGASRESIFLLILRFGLRIALFGLLLGVGVSFLLRPIIANQLFQIQPFDPGALTMACLLLLATAMFAVYVPARRAVHVDPMIALRHE